MLYRTQCAAAHPQRPFCDLMIPHNTSIDGFKSRKETIMKILFVNNDGGGFADYVSVHEGMTVEQFFQEKMPDREPEDYLIRVNRQPVPRDYVCRRTIASRSPQPRSRGQHQ